MAGFRIEGNTSNNVAEVDASNNLKVVLASTSQSAVVGAAADGAAVTGNPVLIAGQDGTNAQSILTDTTGRQIIVGAAADGAAVAGNPVLIGGFDGTNAQSMSVDNTGAVFTRGSNAYGETFEVGANGRVRQSPENPLIQDNFTGSALNTNIWTSSTSTLTQAVANGVLTMNSGAATTANAYSIITSTLQPEYMADFGSYVQFRIISTPQTNFIQEFGRFNAATNAAPTDGFFFRISGTTMTVVMSFNGTETSFTAPSPVVAGTAYECQLEMFTDHIKWYVADSANNTFFTDSGTNTNANPLYLPATQMKAVRLSSDVHLPICARVYNGATPPGTAGQLTIGHASFIQRDVSLYTDLPTSMTCAGRGIYQGPAPASLIQTANWANSSNITAGTLSNTAAAYTTLGGRYQVNATAGATTDFVLFGFQVPTGFQAVITGITISLLTAGAAGGNPTFIEWGMAVGSSTVSLATTESPPTSWAPRRTALGFRSFLNAAPIGTMAPDISVQFLTPQVCDSGRFIQVIFKVASGAATAGQVYTGHVGFNGYWK